jgi:hypothetical protein
MNAYDLQSETIQRLADELWSYKNNGESPATEEEFAEIDVFVAQMCEMIR